MKPPQFDYVAPRSVDDVLAALETPGAVVLAGGQSLVLELAYRQVRPRLVVDINAVPGWDTMTTAADGTRIGPLVRHRSFETDDGSEPVRRLLARIAPYVAHPPIRNRGTLCGSVAWGHPAAEWNAAALALEAELTLSSASGTRTVAAADWFLGRCRTAARPGEVIIEVRLPPAPDATITGFAEHRRTHASFAEVAAVAVLQLSGDIVESARVALAGVADVPLRAVEAEAALTGSPIADAPRRAAAALQRPALPDHHHAVAAELVRRAVAEAVAGR